MMNIDEILEKYPELNNSRKAELKGELLGLFGISYCAAQMKNVLCNRFTNEAKKHVGKKINEVPELAEMLKAIDIIEKHCSIA